jgi:PrtD family type I secretion system ABC transporter
LLQIFNRVVPSKSPDTLLFLTGIVVVAILTLSLLEGARRYIFVRVGSWLDQRLGGLVMSGAITRSVREHRKTSVQGLRDLASVRRLFSNTALFPVLDAPWTPIFLFVIFMLHPLIGLITLIGAVTLFAIALVNERSTRSTLADAKEASAKADNYASAILRNSDAIESMGMRSNVIAEWERHHSVAVDLNTRASMSDNRIASFAKFVRMMLQIAVIAAAGVLVLNNQLSAGGLIASVLLMRRAVAPMDRAIGSWKMIVKARKSFKNVSRQLNQAQELQSSSTLQMPDGDLRVKTVRFQYAKASKPTLRSVTFDTVPGEVIGIAGDTAAGKSTLARVLVGLASPDSGHVRFGGVGMTRWSAQDLGPFVGYMPQNIELFSGSIRQNIARMADGHFERVTRAAHFAGVHDMIMRFPDGYDTRIGDQGAYLSGGQRQKIALARAIYGDPRLIVLDEPDSNLDRDGCLGLARAIQAMKRQGAIVILISHQKSVLDLAARVLTLRNGEIVNVTGARLQSVVKQVSDSTTGPQLVRLGPALPGE